MLIRFSISWQIFNSVALKIFQDTSFTNEIKTEDIVTEVPNKENGTPHQVTTPQSPESFQV